VFITLLVLFIICGYKIFSSLYSDGGNVQQYKTTNKTTDESQNVLLAENHDINWDKLQKDNEDIYSWIYIPNTNVDYPVAQSSKYEADSFYLTHNIKKESEFAGSIYSERLNAKDYSDPVTVIYGHNMKNGSMFKTLHNFEDSDFFKENKYIYIYLPERRLTYQIYSAYVYDDRHILNSFDFTNKKILKKYLKYTQNPESLTKNTRKVDLNVNSRIITLSTCTNSSENTRYLVQGVLIKDEQTNK
jgi:sortase B